MPDAIASAYQNTGALDRYFPLGPIPPDAFLLSLYGIARSQVAGPLNLAHCITLQDAADAGAHAAGRRLLARSSIHYNTQPGYTVALPVAAGVSWTIPLNTMIPGGSAWIITYAQINAGLTPWSTILTVTWLNGREYERLYGRAPAVTVVGVKPPPPPVPPVPFPAGAAFEPM